MEIKSLHEITIDDLFAAREEAFRDYELTLNKTEFIKLLHRRGYSAELSFGAFDDNRLVSFTLNGTGTFYGKPTAYDMGTGTLPDYRGKGLASTIFTTSLPSLKQAGIEQYLLEVLQHNTSAISVYTKLGFKVTREFNYFIQDDIKAIHTTSKTPPGIELRGSDLVQKLAMAAICDFTPSWQNTFDAIAKNEADFKITGAFHNNTLVGYGIIEPAAGDIPQIAVEKAYRRQGIGSLILRELLTCNKHSRVKVINTESTCTSITAFLEHSSIPKKGMQFEMIKKIQ